MAGRPQSIQHNQSAINYVNKKGINELFEVRFCFQRKYQSKSLVCSSGDDDRFDGS